MTELRHPLRVGLKVSGQDTTISELRDIWRIADEAGFDHLWNFDHLASTGDLGPDRPVFEGWALQAAMAVATTKVRIGCGVTGNTYRHPAVLAKLATTVDHLSGGRLEFGIGAAWAVAEHQMYGIDGLDHRIGRLSESLQVLRSLWTEERTDFSGRYYCLTDAIANPKPIQRPHPPIWIGASGDQTIRLAARHADVWIDNESGNELKWAAKLESACAEIGRNPLEIRWSQNFWWDGASVAELTETVGRELSSGFSELVIRIPVLLGAGRAVEIAERAAQALPDLQKVGS